MNQKTVKEFMKKQADYNSSNRLVLTNVVKLVDLVNYRLEKIESKYLR